MFYRRGAPGVASSDAELLGELVPPQNESMAGLARMPASRALFGARSPLCTAPRTLECGCCGFCQAAFC